MTTTSRKLSIPESFFAAARASAQPRHSKSDAPKMMKTGAELKCGPAPFQDIPLPLLSAAPSNR